jgi:hypothetical protein
MVAIVTFPTRIGKNSITLIDNIFINNSSCYTIKPCSNGLSNHEGLILILDNIHIPTDSTKYIQTRIYNNKAIQDFQMQLSHEYWDNVFGNTCVNETFNNFLSTYLRCYYVNFTKITKKKKATQIPTVDNRN